MLKTDITKLSFNRTEFADDADFLSFQKELFAQSLCKTETIPGADCRLLTLVTCSYEWESARTVAIILIVLCAVILGGLVFLHIRNRRKK